MNHRSTHFKVSENKYTDVRINSVLYRVRSTENERKNGYIPEVENVEIFKQLNEQNSNYHHHRKDFGTSFQPFGHSSIKLSAAKITPDQKDKTPKKRARSNSVDSIQTSPNKKQKSSRSVDKEYSVQRSPKTVSSNPGPDSSPLSSRARRSTRTEIDYYHDAEFDIEE
jgi:hypothetical protein